MGRTPWVRATTVLLILLLGLLPIADLIPGGHELSEYSLIVSSWLSGTLIAVGFGWILGVSWLRSDGLAGRGRALATRWAAWGASPRTPLLVAVLAFLAYVIVARVVFSGLPLNIDAIVQVWQGRMYASGSLQLPSPGPAQFFGVPHVIDDGIRRYGQFPVGGPLMLMLGTLVGAEWLVGPFFGAVGVYAFGRLLPFLETRPGVRLGALLLYAFCPFALFMSGSHMNHVTTGAWLVLGLWGIAAGVGHRTAWPMLGAGLAFGFAGIIRPVDAFAFGAPAGAWLAWQVLRKEMAWPRLATFVLAGLVPVAGLAWANWRTTGSPTLFGYQVLWGPAHDLGFHAGPWGDPHTPVRGLELLNLYFFQLNVYLLETPFPSLLPALTTLLLLARPSRWDRYLLGSGLVLVGFYFAYWFGGYYLGPRFMYPLLPLLALFTARAWPALRDRFGDHGITRTAAGTMVTGLLVALGFIIPLRAHSHATALEVVRWSPDRIAAAAGVTEGVVLVRESWGAQLVARLWGLGASRPEAEFLYHNNDACDLERRLEALEAGSVRGAEAVARLRARSDSTGLIKSPFSPDRSESFREHTRYTPLCIRRIEEDRRGFTVLPPTLLAHGPVIWARDLHERSAPLLLAHPGLPVWQLVPPDTLLTSRPVLRRLDRDSLLRAWGSVPVR